MIKPDREFIHRENLLACLLTLTPNQRYSYLQQANYVEKTDELLMPANVGSCLERASFLGHDDLIRCMLDVPTPEQRYELLTTPSTRGEYPILQIAQLPFEEKKMLVVLHHVLSIVTGELRYKLLTTQSTNQKFTALHAPHVDTIKCVFSFLNETEVFNLMQIEDFGDLRPLDREAFFGRFDTVDVFLNNLTPQQRSLLMGKNISGSTPLHYTTHGYGNAVEVAKRLLESIPPERRLELLALEDSDGKTPMQLAKERKSKELETLFKAYKYNVELELKEIACGEFQD